MSIEKMNFKRWVHKVLPAVYDESLSYYELLCKVIAKLNETIELSNDTAEGLKELQDYVANYFEDLDVQDEINNKLDEMAESGELTDIIAQYLQLAGVLAYDTKAEMKSATNLANGSITRTLGNTTYEDGQGAFFKVRQIQNTDIIDDYNIIALNNPNLVAERIPDNKNYYNSKFAQNIIKNISSNIVFAGDSLTYGQNTTGGRVEKAFPQLIQEFVNSWYNNNSLINCINEGVQAARSSQALEDFETYKAENPSTIFWSYGTNDATDNITMNDYIDNLDKFYNLCKENNIELIVIIPPPNYQTKYRKESMKVMEDSLIQYCEANNILYVDMFKYVNDLYDSYTYKYYKSLQADGTHFNNYICYRDAIISKFLPCVYIKNKDELFTYVETYNQPDYIKTNGTLIESEVSVVNSGLRFDENNNQFEINVFVEDDCFIDILGYKINTASNGTLSIDDNTFEIDEYTAENSNNQDYSYNWQFTIPYHVGAGLHKIKLESLTTSGDKQFFYIFGLLIRKNQYNINDVLYPQRKDMIQLWNGNSNNITVPFPTNKQGLNNYCNEINLLLGYADGFTTITINPVDLFRNFYENHASKFVVPNASRNGVEIATFTIDITNHQFVFSSPTLPLRRINMVVNRNHLKWTPNTNTQWFPNV